jgi:hypothetical protein
MRVPRCGVSVGAGTLGHEADVSLHASSSPAEKFFHKV